MQRLQRAGLMLVVTGVMLAPFSLLVPAPTDADTGSSREQWIADAAAERALYGLPSDVATVQRLRDLGNDVGSAQWGLAMTANESRAIDFPARIQFTNEAHTALIPYVESLATFGGYHFDQRNGIRLVVSVTQLDDSVRKEVASRAPAEGAVEVRLVRSTYKELEIAVARTAEVVATLVPDATLTGASLSTVDNGVVIEVLSEHVDRVAARLGDIERELGVSVAIAPGTTVELHHCTLDRHHCDYPMKTGVFLVGATGLDRCAMGFHVRWGTYDERFVTAAHCGYLQSGSWYMQNYGWIGNELDASQYCIVDGIDAMIVDFYGSAESQVSDDVYNDINDLTGTSSVGAGQTVWASLSRSDIVDSGVVYDATYPYPDTTNCGGKQHWGQRVTGITTQGGDSGSPVYKLGAGNENGTAVGTVVGMAGSRMVFVKIGNIFSRYAGHSLITN